MKHTITVHLENEDHFDTAINATVPEIVALYLEKPVPMYYGEDPTLIRACSVVFHNEPNLPVRHGNSGERRRLVKIWNMTDAEMKENGCFLRTCVCYEVTPNNFSPVTRQESCAWLPSSFYDRIK